MTSSGLMGAALVLAAFVAVPASAQQAISEPGAYSFYHPDNDVLNGGAPTPAATMGSPMMHNDAMAQMRMSAPMRHPHHMSIKRY